MSTCKIGIKIFILFLIMPTEILNAFCLDCTNPRVHLFDMKERFDNAASGSSLNTCLLFLLQVSLSELWRESSLCKPWE
jgi:hypothetical protein